MTDTKSAALAHHTDRQPYFLCQYGYISRWEPDAQGAHSVTVANWQGENKGSAKEAGRLIDRANAYPELVAALRGMLRSDCATAYGYKATCAAILAKLGEAA